MFCIIVMNFENSKAEERAKLPRDMLARPPEVKSEYELTLTFSYERDRNGKRISPRPAVLFKDRLVSVEQISTDLRKEKQVLESLHGNDVPGKVTVLIHADSSIPTGLVQQLVKKCQDNGFLKFSLRSTTDE